MKSIFASRLLNLSCILLAAISSVPVSLLYLGTWNPVAALQSATSSLVFLQNGRLVYNTYANQGESNSVNTIPDFSFCGYKGGGVALPFVDVKRTISPVSGDNTQNIQSAIDSFPVFHKTQTDSEARSSSTRAHTTSIARFLSGPAALCFAGPDRGPTAPSSWPQPLNRIEWSMSAWIRSRAAPRRKSPEPTGRLLPRMWPPAREASVSPPRAVMRSGTKSWSFARRIKPGLTLWIWRSSGGLLQHMWSSTNARSPRSAVTPSPLTSL